MRFGTLAFLGPLILAAPAVAATYTLDALSLGCTSDCRDIRGGAVTPADVVTLSGTITTDSDVGIIGIGNIVAWDLVIDGPENPAISYSSANNGTTIPNTSLVQTGSFLGGGNLQFFADGTDFQVTLGSAGLNSTSIFNFRTNTTIDFGGFVVPGPTVSQYSVSLTTDTAGNSNLSTSLFNTAFPLSHPFGTSDSGVDSVVTSSAVVLSGSVAEGGGGVPAVPVPAGGLLLLTGLGALCAARNRKRCG